MRPTTHLRFVERESFTSVDRDGSTLPDGTVRGVVISVLQQLHLRDDDSYVWRDVPQRGRDAEVPAAPSDLPRTYRHKKTGRVYSIVCNAAREADGCRQVVYRDIVSGATWVRPYMEFHDGRFEEYPA